MLYQACFAQELLKIVRVNPHVFALVISVDSTVVLCRISCKSTWLLWVYAFLALHAHIYSWVLLKIIKILLSFLIRRSNFSAAKLWLLLLLGIVELLSNWHNILVVLGDPIFHFVHHFD